MNLPVLILLLGFLYVVFFGALAWLRREGLSGRFAVEAAVLTVIAGGLTALTNFPTHPVAFLFIVYLLTMRVRLVVDVGNLSAQRGSFSQADRLYALALRMWPDSAGRLVVQVNQGVSRLQQGALDEAIAIFKGVLQNAGQGFLGIKYEAATHYNLGVAYRRKGMEAQAKVEFNAVLDTWPVSQYARSARIALEQARHKDKPAEPPQDTPSKA